MIIAHISVLVEEIQVIDKDDWKTIGWTVEISHQAQPALIAKEPTCCRDPSV